MNKYLKLGLGLAAAAGAAHLAYHGYKTVEEALTGELIEAVRAHFAEQPLAIQAVWLCEEPIEASIFNAGVILADGLTQKAVSVEINAATLKIIEKHEEII